MRRDVSRSYWLLALVCAACNGTPEEVAPAAASAAPSAHPVDHLAKGELAQGEEKLFGLPIPQKMRVERRFLDAAHAAGPVTPEDLSNYVRQRVSVAQVEIGAARTVFPRVLIHGGDPKKIYRIEVSPRSGGGSELEVRDITPAPIPSGLSDAERWRRAGRNPDGTPIDPKKLE
ncbi:MAG: hypothetical protein H6718_24960 [Polyangiaceae bacterium]|nr:hypothetical protein [Polyangiaceae bacterium]MCB9605242.1 hypothetical protein [Polyangiaceae bacterium]